MKYLSVCSGIEAATQAWHPLGMQAVAFCENDKQPASVLEHYYPDIPNYGDLNDFKRWPDTPAFDILVGGTPCQSFSVAGLRKGLDDPRGNLALTYLAVAKRFRPRWLVWENVRGVLSSHEGRNFGSLIEAMVKLGYCPAWRVLNAQYFGVPQRRCRVFVVAYLGDWRPAGKVLFERECLRRNPPPRGRAPQDITGTLTRSAGRRRGIGIDPQFIVPEVANPLTARMYKGINTTLDEGQTPIVVHGTQDPDIANPGLAHSVGTDRGRENVVAFKASHYTRGKDGAPSSIAPPLSADADRGDQDTLLFAENQRAEIRELDVAGAISAQRPGKQDTRLIQDSRVRRLTPLECERLQGFPDGYTDIGLSDTARYKALGNSMAVPVMAWLGRRIQSIGR